ncbi:MAG: T9SS type A sorting domain-containing protein [Saprospiraceae bacterium]|nr:T9SS type A sorting domain-containing protein [Saprospiraceae bacterium]
MKNLLRFFSMMILVSLAQLAFAQPGPVCTDLNIPVGPDDSASIVVGDFVTNADASLPDITIENPYGGVLEFVAGANAATVIRIAACPYVSRELKLVAKNANGSCWSRITFKQSNGPIIVGRSATVYCTDSLVDGGHVNGLPPTAFLACTGPIAATYVADWVDVYDCVLGNDTAKVIYRMYEAYDKFGVRGTGQDTITVFRLPQITTDNTWCVDRDTVYCEEGLAGNFGPYMVVPTAPGSMMCDTIYFLNPDGSPAIVDPKCGISVNVLEEPFGQDCISTTKYTVELKQTCYGSTSGACTVDPGSAIETVADGYYRCTFWLMEIDTVPPVVECGQDTLLVPTSGHDCAAHLLLPPVTAADSCNSVVAVKARIEGYGSFALSLQAGYWVSNQTIKLPYTDEVTEIIYEAFDECHNVGYDTCYVRVKDLVAPVAICDKGVNISLTGKKTWVSATTFDEGSWDNCGINFMLARRADWREACLDLCDSIEVVGTSAYGTIYRPYLESNKALDEVEAHYAKVLQWLQWDGQECADVLYNAWRYDLMKYATLTCAEGDHHGFDFDEAVQAYLDPNVDFAKVKQIGGGWAEDVLFSCDDACGPVTVELLVMDYWCNYNTCWTEVWVEDQTPISVPKDVTEEVDISCKTYKDANYTLGGLPVSIADLVAAAHGGDQDAYDALDEIFGGYRKAWVDPYGRYVDIDGEELDCDIVFTDSTCICSSYTTQEPYYDEHFGWVYETVEHSECGYYATEIDLTHGVVAVNCEKNAQCERDIWFDFDECGQGVIYRKFTITQGCPETDSLHTTESITRVQRIWVGNQCKLDPGMFTVPRDTTLDVCDLIYDPEGSGNVAGDASPENIGSAEYVFDDDCRIVGIGYYDKVFKVVGGDEACYKVIRTWCFADWCEVNKPANSNWVIDPMLDDHIITYEQTIILIDTTPPDIVIAPVGTDDVVAAGGCLYDFSTTVDVADACGVLAYRWMLFDADGGIAGQGEGSLDLAIADNFEVAVPGLSTGSYTLRAIATDQCQNEGVAEYSFVISTQKKPAVVCITSLTVELTPMDIDNDGVIDTGMAVVWAEEFNSSSAPACNDDSIAFYIEYLDNDGDETLDEEDADSLAIGCEVLPDAFMVRMWVKSFPSGTVDYCDVMIVPQNNMMACGDISRIQSGVSGSIMTELETNVEQVNVQATLSSGQELDFLTTSAGAYSFASALGLDVTVTPVKTLDPMNGISTADLITIQKHIIGKQSLKNTYREIAADVNNDQRITALDLLVLRKLILGKIDVMPVDSWKFVNNINGKEDYTIQSVNEHMRVDFTGIKMGDVNIDNDPSQSAGRTAKNLVLEIANQKIERAATYEIDVTASNFRNIEGYQFTLNFDPASINVRDIKMGQALDLTDENFGLDRISEGIITTSWNAAEAKNLQEDEVLFTLVVEGVTETAISNVLAVTNKITSAEAYTGSNELLGVAVNFNGSAVEQGFALYQNRPNPFKETTAIGFVLPESSDATLTVYDVTGKVLKVVEGSYIKGYNEVSLQKSELNATGILYYQLDSEAFTATRKMVVID